MASDTWTFRREYEGHTIAVHAVFIPRMETWGLICRVDNVPYDHMQSIDPWTDARSMIDEALLSIGEDNMEAGGSPSNEESGVG